MTSCKPTAEGLERKLQEVFSTTEFEENIFRFLEPPDILRAKLVCRGFLHVIRCSAVIEELLTGVPTPRAARKEILQCTGKTVSDLIYDCGNARPPSETDATRGCIHGFGGEKLVDRNDKAYHPYHRGPLPVFGLGAVLDNIGCAGPCVLNGDSISSIHLNPEPFKRIMCAILVQAAKVSPNTLMIPDEEFKITCDGRLVGDLEWRKFTMTGFTQPHPETTLAATFRWILRKCWSNSIYRRNCFRNSEFVKEMDEFKCALLCPKQIERAFKLACSRTRNLEPLCVILDRIGEDHFLLCQISCGKVDDIKVPT